MRHRAKLSWSRIACLALTLARTALPANPPPTDGGATKPPARSQADAGSAAAELVHWAYRPLSQPTPPRTQDPAWCRDPLDAFVLGKLEELELLPASAADRATFIRRVTFDLTGLPPTLAEVEAFCADESDSAYESLVDRLLASPQFGVAQARAWLDLVRYADSNGSDENQVFAHAWRYRDYVVDSFNSDLPFDRFVQEQIAGDLLPSPERTRERLIATGFLSLGARMLAESDREKLALDTCDEQIDVLSSALLGTTLSCARCHDHKYDPFPQSDYAALAGIFRSTRSFDAPAALSRWAERDIGTPEQLAAAKAYEEERSAAAKRVDRVLDQARNLRRAELLRDLDRFLAIANAVGNAAVLVEAEDFVAGTVHIDRETFGSKDTPVITTNREGKQFAEYRVELPRSGTFAVEIQYASKDSRPLIVEVDSKVIAEKVAESATGGFQLADQRSSLAGEFEKEAVEGEDRPTVTLRLSRSEKGGQHFPAIDWLLIRPATPLSSPWPEDRDRLTPDTPSPVIRALALWLARPHREALDLSRSRDVAGALEALADPTAALPDAALEGLRKRVFSESGPLPPRLFDDEASFAPRLRSELTAMRTELAAIESRKPTALDRALAVGEAEVVELPVFERGNRKAKRGEPIARRAPLALDLGIGFDPITTGSSGRLELARWITSPRNALAVRVQVNRVWQSMFGSGLVRTTSNFGLKGEAPSHPELLEYLSNEFLREGSSRKRLLRRIALSATYRMSSSLETRAVDSDPDGRWHSRHAPRRLTAEELRDSLLLVAEKLDLSLGGSLIKTADREYVPGDPSSDKALFATPRRSLYLPRYRNVPFDYYTLFDAADASVSTGQRTTTTVAPQALWALNSPFVRDMALALATRCSSAVNGVEPSDADRVSRAIEFALARHAEQNEIDRALRFLTEIRPDLKGKDDTELGRECLAAFCEMLFATRAFLYLR